MISLFIFNEMVENPSLFTTSMDELSIFYHNVYTHPSLSIVTSEWDSVLNYMKEEIDEMIISYVKGILYSQSPEAFEGLHVRSIVMGFYSLISIAIGDSMLLISVSSPWVYAGERDVALERELLESTTEAYKLLGLHKRTIMVGTTLPSIKELTSESLISALTSQLREKTDTILREFNLIPN